MLNCRHEYARDSKITIFLIAGVDSSKCNDENGMVPAWRVEPHYLGSTRMRLETVVPFDIHPIHAAWSPSFNVSQSPEVIEEVYRRERQASKERIKRAKGSQAETDRKKDVHDTAWLVGAAVITGGLLYAMRKAAVSQESVIAGGLVSGGPVKESETPAQHKPATTWNTTPYNSTTTTKPRPAPKAKYEHGGTFFE
jgi:hypothetical protein